MKRILERIRAWLIRRQCRKRDHDWEPWYYAGRGRAERKCGRCGRGQWCVFDPSRQSLDTLEVADFSFDAIMKRVRGEA